MDPSAEATYSELIMETSNQSAQDMMNQDIMHMQTSNLMDQNSAGGGEVDGTDKKSNKGGWPKGKKRRKVRDENAPKQPLSGYLRFLNERRDKIRSENPGMSFAEISKLLGGEWSRMAQSEKQRYLDEAERDRERYQRELEAYHQTESYKLFRSRVDKVSVTTSSGHPTGNDEQPPTTPDSAPAFDIPIFTEEFISHNKSREAELRQLRRQNTELEENNAVLSKHIDNMQSAVTKLELEAVQQRNTNLALQTHLDTLRNTLVNGFSSLPALLGLPYPVSIDNIDAYMTSLHSLIIDAPQDHEVLIARVRDTVCKMHIDQLATAPAQKA